MRSPRGLGKTGRMFVCEHFDVVPDILVLGKALGGGVLPVAALLTRPELDVLGDYALGHYTHEKNPVLARAALTTLEIIEDERLVENAARVGAYALGRLEELQAKHPLIGDVRGLGLLLGIELVRDPATKEPATDEADAVLYRCLERGLSFKTTLGNVLSLTPPLTVTEADIERALAIIDAALLETAQRPWPAGPGFHQKAAALRMKSSPGFAQAGRRTYNGVNVDARLLHVSEAAMLRAPGPVVTVEAATLLGCLIGALAAGPALAASAGKASPPATAAPADAEIGDAPELDDASYPDLVADAQRLLMLRGFDPGPIDGQLGLRTRRAIRAYQADARSRGVLEALTGPAAAESSVADVPGGRNAWTSSRRRPRPSEPAGGRPRAQRLIRSMPISRRTTRGPSSISSAIAPKAASQARTAWSPPARSRVVPKITGPAKAPLKPMIA